jgi:serine/threonine-protein kinase ULK/ATG1
LARNDKTGQQVAIKVLKRHGISINQLKNIENEIMVLQNTDHINIVKMVDKRKSQNHYYLILEFCNAGSLASFLDNAGGVNEEIARQITK